MHGNASSVIAYFIRSGKDDIADLFKDIFCNIYNSVSYNKNEMNFILMTLINWLIASVIMVAFCIHDTHSMGAKGVSLSIKRLKPTKTQDSFEIVSSHNVIVSGFTLPFYLLWCYNMVCHQMACCLVP